MKISGRVIAPGSRMKFHEKVASLYDYTDLHLPIEVIRGTQDGPVLFVSAAIHGDEINGVEIIKRVLQKIDIKSLKGAVIATPIVNVFGYNSRSRYLPDRRDLNRSFPGSKKGSLASRLANKFMKTIVSQSTHGIDLHTAAVHRKNLPQIRACLDEPTTKKLAEAFGSPVILHSALRDGSLREAARRKGIPMLLFEGGEALRYDENVIAAGVYGVFSVMKEIGMISRLPLSNRSQSFEKPFVAKDSTWLRAPRSGSFREFKDLGDNVKEGDLLAIISDPFGEEEVQLCAEESGIIIGKSELPLVNQGDAMFHIATFSNNKKVKRAIDLYDDAFS